MLANAAGGEPGTAPALAGLVRAEFGAAAFALLGVVLVMLARRPQPACDGTPSAG